MHQLPETKSQTNIFKPVAFNFLDIQQNADAYLEKVRIEAAKIATETKKEIARLRDEASKELFTKRKEFDEVERGQAELAKKLRLEESKLKLLREEIEAAKYLEASESGKKAGYEEGYQQGYADGEQKALIDYDEKVSRESQGIMTAKLETLMPALRQAVDDLQNSEAMFLTQWEQRAVQVAAAIAQQAISRQLPSMIDVPLKLLKEALELAVGSVRLKIRMNPQDIEALQPEIESLVCEITPAAESEFVGDIRITPGGCFLETSQGTIDQRIESRLSRIQDELSQ